MSSFLPSGSHRREALGATALVVIGLGGRTFVANGPKQAAMTWTPNFPVPEPASDAWDGMSPATASTTSSAESVHSSAFARNMSITSFAALVGAAFGASHRKSMRRIQQLQGSGPHLRVSWGPRGHAPLTSLAATPIEKEMTGELDALPRPSRPLRVAIAGGGVGGLTTALCMLKQGFDVTVYEKTNKFARFGGPIQFASNALSTLKAIDERLFERVMQKFTFTATRRCGIKDGLRSDGSFRMSEVTDPGFLFNPDTPADWFVSFPLKECADFYQLPYTGVINRPDLQDILLDECQRVKSNFIQNGSPVVGYVNHDKGVTVKLEDGTTEEADVLVGADGIWSAVRAQMYDEGEIKKFSADGLTRQGCPYSGYTVFAGETVLKLGDYYDCGYKVYIGPGKYFVTSDVGGGRIQWYAFLALPPGTSKAGDSWEGGSSTAKEGNDVISYLKSLHDGWSSEIFHVLDNTPAESVEQRDLYDRWPEFFRSWAEGSTVLLGDAVHPMMPNLGQGGCQAIEDAYELTKALTATQTYAKDIDLEATREALQNFYRNRVLRVAGVSLLSRLASNLIINFFDVPWSPHDNVGKDWKSYLTFFWKPVLQYLVFPAQFMFLYSYHPSGAMGSLPRQLADSWRARHHASAEEAFDRVKQEGQQQAGFASFFAKAEA